MPSERLNNLLRRLNEVKEKRVLDVTVGDFSVDLEVTEKGSLGVFVTLPSGKVIDIFVSPDGSVKTL